MSKYDFDEDDEQTSDVKDIAKKLTQAKSAKDALIKLLKVRAAPVLYNRFHRLDSTVTLPVCSKLVGPWRSYHRVLKMPTVLPMAWPRPLQVKLSWTIRTRQAMQTCHSNLCLLTLHTLADVSCNSLHMQDVRVCAAHCLCHILRIYAPESPYTTTQLQVMSKTKTHVALHDA